MKRAYKFRLYPKHEQIKQLDNILFLCRKLYNAALEQRILAYRMQRQSIKYRTQASELIDLKEQIPEFKELYSQVLQDTLIRLDKSFDNYYKRIKQKKNGTRIKAGFPRFKGQKRFRSITYPQDVGFEVLPNGHLKLSKIGTIRMFKHRDIVGTPKTCTIKKDCVGDWFAILTTDNPDVERKIPTSAITVDVGLDSLATTSTGEKIKPQKYMKKSENKIKKIQREVSRKIKGSNNRSKCVRRLAKEHRRIERQRDDFAHKISYALSKKGDIVAFENLQINNMVKNHHLAKSIMDAAWGKLMRYTAYKVENTGGQVYYIDPYGTTQICSRCGEWVQKSLKVRVHACHRCGNTMDRDMNAALNILKKIGWDTPKSIKTPAEIVPLQYPKGHCTHGR